MKTASAILNLTPSLLSRVIKTQMSLLRLAPLIFPNTENLKVDMKSSKFNSTDLKKAGERLFLFPELK